jgi:hypothetical protein
MCELSSFDMPIFDVLDPLGNDARVRVYQGDDLLILGLDQAVTLAKSLITEIEKIYHARESYYA